MTNFRNTIEPFAKGYIEAEGEYAGYKIACGMREYATHKEIYINTDEYFAGHFDLKSNIGVRYTYGNGIEVYEDIIDEEILRYPEFADELRCIKEKMLPLRTKTIVQNQKTD